MSVKYDGGTSGGKITNCADATGGGTTVNVGGFQFPIVGGASLEACDTETIGATTCTPGAVGCGWKDGDLTTYPQAAWGNGGSADSILLNNYGTVYAATSFIFQIGSTAGFTAQWTDPTILAKYMPSNGTAAALDANVVDATSTSSGQFGGGVAALKLNIDFGDAGILTGSAPVKFGDLNLCGFTSLTGLNGKTVREFLDIANTALGGGSTGFTISDLDNVTEQLDASFAGGAASTFAQDHLVNGTCP